jgi:hypothetical protein
MGTLKIHTSSLVEEGRFEAPYATRAAARVQQECNLALSNVVQIESNDST